MAPNMGLNKRKFKYSLYNIQISIFFFFFMFVFQSLAIRYFENKSSHRRCSVRKGALRNFAKFTGKTCARDSFLIKMQKERDPEKKGLSYRCFLVNFVKFLRTPFLQNTSKRLLLHSCLYFCFRLNVILNCQEY